MWGNGKLSFRRMLFKSIKTTRTLIFSFFFCTTTGWANHIRYWTSQIIPLSKSLFTSSFTLLFLSTPSFLLFYFFGQNHWSMFNWWVIAFVLTPPISKCDHAKRSLFLLKNIIRSSLNSSSSVALIFVTFQLSSRSRRTSWISSSLGSSFSFFLSSSEPLTWYYYFFLAP